MLQVSFPLHMIRVVSVYENRSAQVKVSDTDTENITIAKGVASSSSVLITTTQKFRLQLTETSDGLCHIFCPYLLCYSGLILVSLLLGIARACNTVVLI